MSNEFRKQVSYILCNNPDETIKFDGLIREEVILLTQKMMTALFGSTDYLEI